MPEYIKQLKIGNTDYNIKAEKAASQNQDLAVVRDIAYGTTTPSGGDTGAMYLQYDADSITNPYVYAEDTVGDQQNTADLYVTKNELTAGVTSAEFRTSSSIPANTAYLPNNILMKWGKVVGATSNNQRINFSTPFPNACVLVVCGAEAGAALRLYGTYVNGNWDKNGFYATIVAANKDETYYSSGNITYIAIGY